MIVSYLNRSLGMLFLMACFAALMNPPPYILIGAIFLVMGLVLLPSTNQLAQRTLKWKIKGGTQATVVLTGFLLVCLVVPQVQLETTPLSTSYLRWELEDRS